MSEYIKREDVINKLADEYVFDARSEYEGTFTRADFIDDAKETLADIPNADVVEVKHGHWDFYGLVDDVYGHGASCSVCGGYSEDNGYYCSCCGAKMDDALQRKTNPEAFKVGD